MGRSGKSRKSARSSGEQRPAASQSNPLAKWGPLAFIAAVFLAAAFRLFSLISEFAVNIFYSDQWDFNDAPLFQQHTLWEMFRWQHGPIRQGVGALVSHFIEPSLHWSSRSNSFLVGVILVLAAVAALWLKYRLFGSFTYWDALIPVIFLTPLQYETIVVTANLAHGPVPLLLLMFYCASWSIQNLRWRYASIVFLNFLILNTGFGIFLGLVTPFALLADFLLRERNRKLAWLSLAVAQLVAIASMAQFFTQYVYQTAADCPPNLFDAPDVYAQFVFLMFGNLFAVRGTDLFPAIVGAALLFSLAAALLFVALRLRKQGSSFAPRALAIFSLILYCVLYALASSYGRSCMGLQFAQVSRYVVYLGSGLLGLYFALLTIRSSAWRTALLALLCLSLLPGIPTQMDDRHSMYLHALVKRQWKACYLAELDIHKCDDIVHHHVYPRPEVNNLKGKLEFLREKHLNLFADTK